jgi:hypothetical protein
MVHGFAHHLFAVYTSLYNNPCCFYWRITDDLSGKDLESDGVFHSIIWIIKSNTTQAKLN